MSNVVAFETDKLGSTCVQLRRAAMVGGSMLRSHGRFAEVAEWCGVRVVDSLPGPYTCALDAAVPPFTAAVARVGSIVVSERSSRGGHPLLLAGKRVDDVSLSELRTLVETASALVGPNSGAAHFAALFGCRTIIFDNWNHHAMLPEGAGHWFTWTDAGLNSVLNSL